MAEVLKTVEERYKKYLTSTPLERLELKHEKKEIEEEEKYERLSVVIFEMLLRALPSSIATEAIAKRMKDPTEVMLFVMIKYKPGGRK